MTIFSSVVGVGSHGSSVRHFENGQEVSCSFNCSEEDIYGSMELFDRYAQSRLDASVQDSVLTDSDGVKIVEGSRLVWASPCSSEEHTGVARLVVSSELSYLVICGSRFTGLKVSFILETCSWSMVAPAYPRSLVREVA